MNSLQTVQNKIKVKTVDLSFFYGKEQSLFSINLEIPENKVSAIIGPSGCGKSTFLRTLNKIYDLHHDHKASGKIIVDGTDILSNDISTISLRRKIGMIFQKPTPFAMSIYDNVAYGIKLHYKIKKSNLDDLVKSSLEKSALWSEVKDKLKVSAFSLSGGQQQRLCIARTIALSPEIVLMDEPTSALDPTATGKIEDLIENLKSQITIIIVTHNMQQAARVSDETSFFLNGHLIEHGPTQKIFTSPDKKETADYITGRFG